MRASPGGFAGALFRQFRPQARALERGDAEHEAILDALRRRAASELSDILFQHLRNKGAAAITYFAEEGTGQPEAPARF